MNMYRDHNNTSHPGDTWVVIATNAVLRKCIESKDFTLYDSIMASNDVFKDGSMILWLTRLDNAQALGLVCHKYSSSAGILNATFTP